MMIMIFGNFDEGTNREVSVQVGVRRSRRLARVHSHSIMESRGLTANNIMRQRPTLNSAIPTIVLSSDEDDSD